MEKRGSWVQKGEDTGTLREKRTDDLSKEDWTRKRVEREKKKKTVEVSKNDREWFTPIDGSGEEKVGTVDTGNTYNDDLGIFG